MPLIGEFHTKYWENSDTNAPPVHIGRGGYPVWQASVITPSLFGMVGAWLDTKLAQWRWWRALYRRIGGLTAAQRSAFLDALDDVEYPKPPMVAVEQLAAPEPAPAAVMRKPRFRPSAIRQWWQVGTRVDRLDTPRKALVTYALDLMESTTFPYALQAVQETAQTLGFNRPEAWTQYSRAIKGSPGRAENVFRHEKAAARTRELCGSTLTNPQANLLVELAYHAWSQPWMSSNGHV